MYAWIALFLVAGCALISGMTKDNSFLALGLASACLMFTSISINKNELQRREIIFLKQLRENNVRVMYQLLEHHNDRLRKLELKFPTENVPEILPP